MKKLIALALTLVAAHGAFAQGTVQFQNAITSFINTNNGTASGRLQSSMNFTASLYWGTTANNVTTLAGTELIGASSGVLNGSTLFAVTGAPAGSTAFFQIVVTGVLDGVDWSGSTAILPFQLAAAQGPGTVMFGSGTPQTSPSLFHSITVVPVPEPSTIALAGLGAASLLLFRRRK